jgi:hypothetical protein
LRIEIRIEAHSGSVWYEDGTFESTVLLVV